MSKIDLGQDCEKQSKNKFSRKHKRDMKLQELEKQLQFAESRCGTLKQQLDYIKRLYGGEYNLTSKDNGSYTSLRNGLGDGDADNVNCYNCATLRKNSSNLDFEAKNPYDCEEVGPEFGYRNASLSKTKTFNSGNQFKAKPGGQEKKIGNYSKSKSHLKVLKLNKKKNFKKFKGRKKMEETLGVGNVSSQSHTQIWQDPLVEIYKNSALKAESESGLELAFNGRRQRKGKDVSFAGQKQRLDADNNGDDAVQEEMLDVSPPTKIYGSANEKKVVITEEEELPVKSATEPPPPTVKQTEYVDFLKKDTCFFEQEKGYCQPTISSRKKQVDKDVYSCFRNINIRNIPFIAAKSTAPSHNIGINIQQVLSIMKKKVPVNENFINPHDLGTSENSLLSILAAKRGGGVKGTFENEGCSEGSSQALGLSESKRKFEPIRTHLSHWTSNSDFVKEKEKVPEKVQEPAKKPSDDDPEEDEWSYKVNKLKKVLVFLHEDFMSLSQKYKKLQKKLVKRNITTIEAKGELADIEKDLEKKEEEITIVIGLYKEVLHLKENLKKLHDKYILITSGKITTPEGSQQTSSSTHFQMQSLLRKIQNFQDRLKS